MNTSGRALRGCVAAILFGIGIGAPSPGIADPVEDFYKGKQIRIIIRAGPGGNYDLYSRLLIRHMVKYIPGKPVGLPVNMPGGSGLTALAHVAEVAPKDGTVLTMVTQTFPVEQALGLNKNLKTDLRRLNWLGNMSETNTFLLTSRLSPTKTIEDAKRRETVMAVPSTADVTAWLTAVLNNTLGTKFKLVAGYHSGPAMNLAMERNEVEGRGTTNPRTMFVGSGAGDKSDNAPAFNLLLQSGLKKEKDYPEVPLLRDLATSEDQRVVFDFFSKMGALARPLAMAADVPPERIVAMRAAFAKTMADADFLAEARQQAMEISMMDGDDVQQIVDDIVNAPPAVVERVKAAIQVKGAVQIDNVKGEPESK
jgi:tripartite-type tricarboxylate transporter receptor subunit TctC